MSNNKQVIKLYTEEQVKKVIKDSFLQGIERNTNYESVKKSILNSLTPIELPSDEELKKQFDVDEFDPYDVAYLGGAIRMRNLIQGGNNEQQ